MIVEGVASRRNRASCAEISGRRDWREATCGGHRLAVTQAVLRRAGSHRITSHHIALHCSAQLHSQCLREATCVGGVPVQSTSGRSP